MNHSEIIDTASILIVGGSETTATLLCGLTYYLLTTPHVLKRLQSEIFHAFTTEDEINLRTVSRLPYLDAVVQEALRMYPPASSTFPRRTPREGEIIDGQFVPGNVYDAPFTQLPVLLIPTLDISRRTPLRYLPFLPQLSKPRYLRAREMASR